jgi:hypothetical protein
MSEKFDVHLKERLLRLEEEMPDMSTRRTRPNRSLRLPLAVVVLVGILGIATGAAAASVVMREAGGSAPGVFTAEGPLYCSGIHEMSPGQADPLLRELGYQVTWQIEDRDAKTSVQSAKPPSNGFIVEGAIVNGELILVVERGQGVQRVADPCPWRN